mgnify:FL=1
MRHERIVILIKKLALVSDKQALSILAPIDLTPSQYKIVKYLIKRENEPVRQVDIERYYSMTNPAVTGIVKNMEAKGWITREQNPEDSRSKLIRLTPMALSRKEELYSYGDRIENALIRDLTEEEQDTLVRLLGKLIRQEEK